jgi:FixJ family two-component response regulator
MTMPALVCVIDDEASVRKSLVRLLASAGLVAEAFPSAQAYLDRVVHDGATCLVLDVRMPELTGPALQQQLLTGGRDEQIVFITGDGDIPTSVEAMKAGAVDFLSKPFKDDEFLAAVNRALERAQVKRQRRAEHDEARERFETLTPREHQVLQGVIAGKMNKEIAAELGTSIRTVKVQRGRVMTKMKVTSVAELVRIIRKTAPGSEKG